MGAPVSTDGQGVPGTCWVPVAATVWPGAGAVGDAGLQPDSATTIASSIRFVIFPAVDAVLPLMSDRNTRCSQPRLIPLRGRVLPDELLIGVVGRLRSEVNPDEPEVMIEVLGIRPLVSEVVPEEGAYVVRANQTR